MSAHRLSPLFLAFPFRLERRGAVRPMPRIPNRMRPAAQRQESDPMQRSLNPVSRLHQDAVQFRIILATTYPFFLAAALAQRVAPSPRDARPGRDGLAPRRRSVFAEARAMAVSAIPFAFMG